MKTILLLLVFVPVGLGYLLGACCAFLSFVVGVSVDEKK